MNRRFKNYAICWAIMLVLFNVICFVTPKEVTYGDMIYTKFDASFWTAYAFITLGFIGQLVCANAAFKASNAEKLFYNIPLIRISYSGLILTLIFGVLCMAIPNLPYWVCVVLSAIILAFTAIAVVKAKAAAEEVQIVGEKVKAKTAFIKGLIADAEILVSSAKNSEEKELCKKVYEAIRYSDPMSSEELYDSDVNVKAAFNAFSSAMTAENAEQLISAVKARNAKCKALK